jgi:hypothetical protein
VFPSGDRGNLSVRLMRLPAVHVDGGRGLTL